MGSDRRFLDEEPGGRLIGVVTKALIEWGECLQQGKVNKIEVTIPAGTTEEHLRDAARLTAKRGFTLIRNNDQAVIRRSS